MGPIAHDAVRAEIVGIALWFDRPFRRIPDLVFEPMFGREGNRFVFAREFDLHLVAPHILAADPAHQTVRPFGSAQFEFQHPIGGLSQTGLHGGFGWLIDARDTQVAYSDQMRLLFNSRQLI